uniref:AAA+ ATPase domain-containing protein n=1 Tax=Oryza barthii TaxID=65489 RepID=A0A0D3FAA8_9ORYZ
MMRLKVTILVVAFVLSAGVHISAAAAAAGQREEVHLVPAVYVFGDSTVDVGNNQYLPGNSPLQLPYGIDFPHSRPTGRFSNGYNVADFIAKLVGFKRSPPAYLSLTPQTSRQLMRGYRGANYASGGSGILDTTGTTVVTLTKQIVYFAATKSKMKSNGGGDGNSSSASASAIDDLLSKSLFLISDGGNDLFAFLRQSNRTASQVPSFYADLLSNYTRHVQALYSLGARRFGIIDVPPIGCVPSVRVTSPAGATRCVDAASDLARGFNSGLRSAMARLAGSGALPGMRYSVGSSYNVVSYLTANPAAAGFKVVNSACCGGGRLNAQVGCGAPNSTYCGNRNGYLFWDGVHGTQATSRKGAAAIYSAPPQMGFASPINFKQLNESDRDTIDESHHFRGMRISALRFVLSWAGGKNATPKQPRGPRRELSGSLSSEPTRASKSQTPPPLQNRPAAASPSHALGSRLGFLNGVPGAPGAREASAFTTAGFLAAGAAAALASLPVAYADANEVGVVDSAVSSDAAVKPVNPDAAVSSDVAVGEDLAHKERKRIMELIQSRGMPHGSYPQFDVAVKGQKVVVKFNVPSTCSLSDLIVDLVTHIGLEAEQGGGGSEMLLHAWNSVAARQITLNPHKKTTSNGDDNEDDLCVLIFEPLVGSQYSEVEFIKRGEFSLRELEALTSVLKLVGQKDVKQSSGKGNKSYTTRKGNGQRSKHVPSMEKTISDLEGMGVRVYGFDETSSIPMDGSGTVMWENIAGYEPQKREIEDTILLALQSPEVYDEIARATRCKFETNRPRAVLFEGPPGTGKTSSARVIAKQAGVPLLYVPLEIIMSKYYGESERLLGSVFSLANDLPDGGIIFLDEVDSFASARDSEMHEATRRILSVILRQIDGFEQDRRVVVIAATNRKEDLDPALISRFDSIICFDLPDQQTRAEISAQYAKHLTKSELFQFSLATEEMSGRDIRDICQQAERHWASKLIRGQVPKNDKGEPSLPPVEEYVACSEQRRRSLPNRTRQESRLPALKLA